MPSSEEAPLTGEELEGLLEEVLDPVLSSRRTAAPLAQALAPLPAAHQHFVLHWAAAVAASSTELAYQVVALAPEALSTLDLERMEGWLVRAMDVYDREGLYAASAVLKDLRGYDRALQDSRRAVAFEEVARFLGLFLRGLAGRHLDLQTSDPPFTDTATVFLPESVSFFGSPERNRTLYKCTAAHLWAQTRFGTFNADLEAGIAECGERFAALANLATLEAVRLGARIADCLPGLTAEMTALRTAPLAPEAAALAAGLQREEATVEDSLAVLRHLGPAVRLPQWPYVGVLIPERASQVRAARIESERATLRVRLAALLQESRDGRPERSSGRFEVPGDADKAQEMTLLLDGRPVAPPEDVAQLLRSIALDLGEIPADYLVAAGPGAVIGAGASRPCAARTRSCGASCLVTTWTWTLWWSPMPTCVPATPSRTASSGGATRWSATWR